MAENPHRIETIGQLFDVVRTWEKKFFDPRLGFPSVWYRGHADAAWELQPTVLRRWFVAKAREGEFTLPQSIALLAREKTINRQFRRMSASMLPCSSVVDIYFHAQHNGLPTRLLDWTTSPLVALFFAVSGEPGKDGMLYAINPRDLIPADTNPASPDYPTDIVDVRHAIVELAIKPLFDNVDHYERPFILPVFPDLHAGRMNGRS